MCFDSTKVKQGATVNTNGLTEQQATILNILKRETNATSGLGLQAWQLRTKTGYPTPSIRRAIGELRASGYVVKNVRYVGYVLDTTTPRSASANAFGGRF